MVMGSGNSRHSLIRGHILINLEMVTMITGMAQAEKVIMDLSKAVVQSVIILIGKLSLEIATLLKGFSVSGAVMKHAIVILLHIHLFGKMSLMGME